MVFIRRTDALAKMESKDAPPMWIFDQETLDFLEVNTAAIECYGYSREEFLSMTILDIRPLEDVTALVRETMDPQTRGASTKEKWRHKAKSGSVFTVEITSWELTWQNRKAELVSAIPITRPEFKPDRATHPVNRIKFADPDMPRE